jgi:hypothetical protein
MKRAVLVLLGLLLTVNLFGFDQDISPDYILGKWEATVEFRNFPGMEVASVEDEKITFQFFEGDVGKRNDQSILYTFKQNYWQYASTKTPVIEYQYKGVQCFLTIKAIDENTFLGWGYTDILDSPDEHSSVYTFRKQ